jgi:chemotaxis protein CheD
MGENLRSVAIGRLVVSGDADDVLVTYGIGSCVAICLYDPLLRVGGMLHALIPTSPNGDLRSVKSPRFVDEGVVMLLEELGKWEVRPSRAMTYLCGGAQVLSLPNTNGAQTIGERNVQAAEAALRAAGLSIRGQLVGGTVGRTVKLYIATGDVTVRSLGHTEVLLDK